MDLNEVLNTQTVEEELKKLYGEEAYNKLASFDAIYDTEGICKYDLEDFTCVNSVDFGKSVFCGRKGKSSTLFEIDYGKRTYKEIVKSNCNGLLFKLIGSKKYDEYAYNSVDEKNHYVSIGLVNKKGKIIAKSKFTNVGEKIIDGVLPAQKRTEKLGEIDGIINNNHQFKDFKMYDNYEIYDKNLIKVTKNFQSGIINEHKDIIIPIKYNAGDVCVENTEAGKIILIKENNKWKCYDYSGFLVSQKSFKNKGDAISYANEVYEGILTNIE